MGQSELRTRQAPPLSATLQLQLATAVVIGCDTARLKTAAEKPLMQIFANLLRWLAGSGARRAHVKRADDLLKKLSRSLSSK